MWKDILDGMYVADRYIASVKFNLNWLLLHTVLFLLNNRHTFLHFSDMSWTFRSSVSKHCCVPKLNVGKRAFYIFFGIIIIIIIIVIISSIIISIIIINRLSADCVPSPRRKSSHLAGLLILSV